MSRRIYDEGPKEVVIDDQGTAADSLDESLFDTETAEHAVEFTAFKPYTRRAALLRDRVDLLNTDIREVHHQAQDYHLEELAHKKAKQDVRTMLEELSTERGMSWASIARLVDVSVGAVRKWRRDGGVSGEKRLSLGKLAASLDLLEAFAVKDPASWLEIPIIQNYTVTGLDIYRSSSGPILLLDYAGARLTRTELLDQFDPLWREHFSSDFEVYLSSDDEFSIRPKNR